MLPASLLCMIWWPLFVNAKSGDSLTVNTSDGDISGLESLTADGNRTFWSFHGIPYAEPPIGKLRFKDPQPVKPWRGIRDATYQRTICTQEIKPVKGGEDCLYLNVFTTVKPGNRTELKPVMVWIHGGAFIGGSGNIGHHGADRFLDYDVILVTLNYRLGVFGFLCTQDDASPGNYGLKDQIFALKWVNKNIQTFGGDPAKVTIFGHSAGSASIHYLLQSKLTKGLYWAAIAQSESSLNPWSVILNPRSLAFKIGAKNFIFGTDSRTLVNDMRKVHYKKLQDSVTGFTLNLRDNFNGFPWAPCIERNQKNAVVTSYNYIKQRYGDFNRVPIMEGFTSNEARELANIKYLSTFYSFKFSLDPEKLVPKDMNSVNTSGAAAEIRAFYIKNGSATNNSEFIHYGSDFLYVRGIRKSAQFHSKYVQTYLYRFSFTGGITHKSFVPEGAWHTEELQFLFNFDYTKQVTPKALKTQNRMLKLWTNFAKYRNPIPGNDPLLTTKWPVMDSKDNEISYLDIGDNLVKASSPEAKEMTFWDNLYDNFGFEPYNAY